MHFAFLLLRAGPMGAGYGVLVCGVREDSGHGREGLFIPACLRGQIKKGYHPNYLWRNDINRYFEAIIQEITL
jgi:hypothetical protein